MDKISQCPMCSKELDWSFDSGKYYTLNLTFPEYPDKNKDIHGHTKSHCNQLLMEELKNFNYNSGRLECDIIGYEV